MRARDLSHPVFFSLLLVSLLWLASPASATEPPVELGVCKIEGAPGCEFIDGMIVVGNENSTYYYKLNMSITCAPIRCTAAQCGDTSSRSNVVLAPKFCTPGQTPGCFEQITCVLNNCPAWGGVCGSCQTCDNYQSDCGTEDQLCTGVSGSVTVTAWSTDGVNWTSYGTPVSVPESSYCSGGNSCD